MSDASQCCPEGARAIVPPRPTTAFEIPPRWRIAAPGQGLDASRIDVVMAPGPGFGSGEHPTTQVCLQAISAVAPRAKAGWRMLDFGSGSGILAIGAAKLGAKVEAVEIDPQAIEHGEENVRLNGVADRVRFSARLDQATGPFELIVANILRPVLLDFAPELAARLAAGGALVLSGLVSTDVPEVGARYATLLGRPRPEVYERGEWRALVWRATPHSS
jgi:ribosomal protein L11 methyltransferase